jgi:hypothetical protein
MHLNKLEEVSCILCQFLIKSAENFPDHCTVANFFDRSKENPSLVLTQVDMHEILFTLLETMTVFARCTHL